MNPSPLSDYEAREVREIAAWKAEEPGLFTRVASGLTKPVAWALQHVVPDAASHTAIKTAYAASDWLAGPGEILSKGGVATLDELRHQSLELSDRLADMVAHRAQTVAAIDGAVTGAGGFFLAAADVGALAVVALRAIHRTGQCYGQALDQPHDRSYVLGILMVVSARTLTERLEMLGNLERVESWVLAETVEALALERLAGQLVQLASLEAIPGIGAVIGTGTNLLFIRQVLRAARCVFQERWLRENGKVAVIAAAAKPG